MAREFCWNISIIADQTVFILPTQKLLQKWHHTPRLVLPDLVKSCSGMLWEKLLGVDSNANSIYTFSIIFIYDHEILLVDYCLTSNFYITLHYVSCSGGLMSSAQGHEIKGNDMTSGKFCFCIANPTSCTMRAARQ